jgi:hypothetical protein
MYCGVYVCLLCEPLRWLLTAAVYVGQATANKLTDDALLGIFDSYLSDNSVSDRLQNVNKWHTLVHVCRRWRDLVFVSPRRLNLRLLCRKARPVREMLDIWPALPIEIEDIWMSTGEAGQDNIIAAQSPSCPISSPNVYFPVPPGSMAPRKTCRWGNI